MQNIFRYHPVAYISYAYGKHPRGKMVVYDLLGRPVSFSAFFYSFWKWDLCHFSNSLYSHFPNNNSIDIDARGNVNVASHVRIMFNFFKYNIICTIFVCCRIVTY